MSYDIFYSKQFILLPRTKEVIPMFLAGSNNCYEIGQGGRNGRRTRDWSTMRYYNRKGKISEKPEVIIKNLDADLRRVIRRHRSEDGVKPADIRNHYGYYASLVVGSGHCYDTSWNMWRAQFLNGIRKALTIEQLDDLGINLYFSCFETTSDGQPAYVSIKTEREYFIELKKWRQWQGGNGKHFYLSLSPHNTDMILSRLRSTKKRAPRERTKVEQNHYYVLRANGMTLVKYTRNGYRYSPHPSSGKRFMTRPLANKYRKDCISKGRYKAEAWKVERVNLPMTFMI